MQLALLGFRLDPFHRGHQNGTQVNRAQVKGHFTTRSLGEEDQIIDQGLQAQGGAQGNIQRFFLFKRQRAERFGIEQVQIPADMRQRGAQLV